MSKASRYTIAVFVPVIIVLFLFSPERYANSFWNGLCIWALNVLPVLLPFAFLSTLWTTSLQQGKRSFCKSIFGINCDKIFLSSIICGYPVGAQQIYHNCNNTNQAEHLFSFCSTSSPIFIIATVGLKFLNNITAGVIIACSQLIACVINGIIFCKILPKAPSLLKPPKASDKQSGFDLLLNTILSTLSVGALIALFVMLGDILKSFIPSSISNTPAFSFALGLLETTSGIITICQNTNIFTATVLSSALLAFGGICVFLQCLSFLQPLKVSVMRLIKMKITQCAFASIITYILSVLFL